MNEFTRHVVAAVIAGTLVAAASAGPLEDGMEAYQEKDYLKAIQVWRPLAQAGDREAQYRLGVMYAEGRGIPPNDAEAALWFERAAEQGEPMAQYNLAASYVEGTGVRKDMAAAAKWFRRAADQGVPLAQLNLGLLYASGAGVAPGQRRGAQMDRPLDLRAACGRHPLGCGESRRRRRRQDEQRRDPGGAKPRARLEGEGRDPAGEETGREMRRAPAVRPFRPTQSVT